MLICNEDPTTKLAGYVNKVQEKGYPVSITFIHWIFKEWRWSWKRPSFKQLQKYTPAHLERYHADV